MEDALGEVVKKIKVFLEIGQHGGGEKSRRRKPRVSVVMHCSVTRELKLKTLKAIAISEVDLRKDQYHSFKEKS